MPSSCRALRRASIEGVMVSIVLGNVSSATWGVAMMRSMPHRFRALTRFTPFSTDDAPSSMPGRT